MTASIQDHFHLMDTVPDAAEEDDEWMAYAPSAKPSMKPTPMIFSAPKWSLTGRLWSHVLQSGGSPVKKDNWRFQVYLTDEAAVGTSAYADFLTWVGYAGKEMYFVPNYHDPADHQSYYQYVLVQKVGEPEVEGVQYDKIIIPVELLDLTA